MATILILPGFKDAPWIDKWQAVFDIIEDMLLAAGTGDTVVFVGTRAERENYTPAAYVVWYERDYKAWWGWDGAAWVRIGAEVLDEDDMASNSAEAIPTQQSVKAHVGHQAVLLAQAFG